MGARAAGHRANGADRAGPTSPRRGGVPSEPVRTQVIPSDRPRGRWRAAAYGPRVGGPDPADTPTKGGSRGAAPPGNLGIRTGQRPTIHRLHRCRGPNGPRASVIPAMWGSRAFLSTARNEPGTGARRMSRGSRARPLLDAPNTVDSLDDPTKDAARRPLESRNHGWDGRLPPTTDLDRADIVRANVPGSGPGWRGAHFVWGGPCVDPRAHTKWASLVRPLLGPQGDLVTRAVLRARAGPVVANGAGPLAPFHSSSYICSVHQLHICTPPCPRQLVSSARAARYSLQEGARRPTGHSRGARPRPLSIPVPVCLCGCLYMARAPPAYIDPGVWRAPANWSLPGRARARPLSTPASVSVCLYKCLSMARPPACWSAPPPPRAPANWPPSRARPHPDPSTPGSGPPRGASHRANSASQLATALPHRALTGAPPPPSPSPSPSSPRPPPPRHPRARTPAGPRRRRPPGPYNGARARLSARYEGARAGPTPLDLDLDPALAACLPACLPAARASDGPSPTHTHRPRPARNRACKRSRVRKSFRGEAHLRWQPARLPRGHVPRPTGHRPSSPGGGARGSLLPVRARARPSRPANWRRSMEVEVRGNRSSPVPPRVSGERCLAPLQAPGAAGPQQGYLTAYTTRLVTSVVCRGFIPARGDIAIRQPAPGGFSPGAVASLLRCMARRPIRIQLRRAGLHRRVPARILT
ncbi:hypothetical protein ALT_5953 [Aspergillus lentulus]|uniref:Uncharacterized protein n=1 Tax=Aspergillus lentulus TaxID=293939 RepID=A0AAN4TCC3_ASPLE|nr:hypothetical protein ALT_5938 [Aspergillus lentulus]GAQ08622.1 hypothetical protein ALT_5943 [Aspergillus lentulus]GAQ08632.1 hypothetical protein ALT_5953 [Aspergillus lentulus]